MPPGLLRLKQDSWILINDPEKLNDDATSGVKQKFQNLFEKYISKWSYLGYFC